ncbi:Calx-beta domain-containing protein, partial [Neptunomonas concharum]
DNLAEATESYTVTMTNVTGGGFENTVLGVSQVTTVITDEPVPGPEDTALVSIVGDQTIIEGNTSTVYTVSVDQAASDVTTPITVALVYSGVAIDGTDFTGVANVTIPAGSNSVDFTIDTLDDNLAEGSEVFTITLGAITDTNFEAIEPDSVNNSVDTTITDNDVVGISVNDVTVNEDDGSMTFTVTLSNPSTSPVTVDYATQDGTATAGLDYTAVSDTLTFAPGVTSLTVTVPVTDDFIAEGAETLDLVLSNPTNATIIDNVGLGTILDEPVGSEDAALVSITGDQTIVESELSAVYTVSVNRPASEVTTPITVALTYSGVAIDGTDFTGVASVTIPAGSNSVDFNIQTLDDVFAEGSESFTITLGTITDGNFEAISADPSANNVLSNIIDEPTPGPEDTVTVNLTGPTSVPEGDVATYTVTLTEEAVTDMTLNVTLTHIDTVTGDISSYDTTVTVAAGSSTGTFDVNTQDDFFDEGTEDYNVSISLPAVVGGGFENVVVGTDSQTTGIIDNDTTPIIVTPGEAHVSEEGFDIALGFFDQGIPDGVGSVDQTDSASASGTISATDADGGVLSYTLDLPTGPSANLSSGGEAVTWALTDSQTLVGSTSQGDVIRVTIDNNGNYDVDLLRQIDHTDPTQEDTEVVEVPVIVSDGTNSSSTNLTVVIEDDSPTTGGLVQTVHVPIDTISVTGLQAGFINSVASDGTSTSITNIELNDGDALTDQLEWGTAASSAGRSGYVFVDDTGLKTGELVTTNSIFEVGQFTHNNFPVFAPSLDTTVLSVNFTVNVNGVDNPLNMLINLDHNETPNNGADPRDIITISGSSQSFTVDGQDYEVVIRGFSANPGDTPVTQIFTDENAANTFTLYAEIVSTDPLPSISGNVTSKSGADGIDTVVWGSTSSSYGTMAVNSDGSYDFTVNRATKDSLAPDEVITESFSYTVTDNDGDTATSSVTILIAGATVVAGATSGNDTLTGTSNADFLIGIGGNDILTGGDGDDVFQWLQGDTGSDTVTDFAVYQNVGDERDVLDLSDLLQGESHDLNTLTNYLSFSQQGSDTLIEVSSSGTGGPDQTILLQNVDLGAGVRTDAEIIQELLDNNQLIVD